MQAVLATDFCTDEQKIVVSIWENKLEKVDMKGEIDKLLWTICDRRFIKTSHACDQ